MRCPLQYENFCQNLRSAYYQMTEKLGFSGPLKLMGRFAESGNKPTGVDQF